MDVPTKPSIDQAPIMPDLAPDADVAKLLERYVASVRAYTSNEPGADEIFMRAVEWLMDIPAHRTNDMRREIMNYVGALAVEGKKLTPGMNQRLDAALDKLLLARKTC
jgi:serine protein kinase